MISILKYSLHLSTTQIRRAKRSESGILLDGENTFVNQPVHAGQFLEVELQSEPSEYPVSPVPGPLQIIYEDDHFIVLHKPAGLCTHPSRIHPEDSISNLLAHYFLEKNLSFGIHPVSRLDRGTSGLILFAKYPHIQYLFSQQQSASFKKVYFAIAHNIPNPLSGLIDAPISRDPSSILLRMISEHGQTAKTEYQTICQSNQFSLIRCTLLTGRTHQIRVHLKSLGCPLVGDFLYGTEEPELIDRPALHAGLLEVIHPITHEKLCLSDPFPPDFQNCMKKTGLSCP